MNNIKPSIRIKEISDALINAQQIRLIDQDIRLWFDVKATIQYLDEEHERRSKESA